jgi:hypothetical protein
VKFASLLALLLAAQPGAALACSIPYDPRPMEVQIDEWAVQSYSNARAMVEVVALRGSSRRRPGLVRVIRVLKGPIRPGRILSLHSVEASLCGAGQFRSRSRGLVLLDGLSGRLVFKGYLPSDYLTRLDRLGLRPLDSPARR